MIHSRRRSREGEDAPRRASRLRRRSTTLLYIRRVGRTLVRSLAVDACNTVPNETYIFFRPSTRTAERSRELSLSLSLSRSSAPTATAARRAFVRPHVRYRLFTVYDTTFTPCRRMYRSRPTKSSKIPHLGRTHTLLLYNHTYTVPFSAHKIHTPRGSFPLEMGRRRIQNYSYSLSSLGRRSVDADARRPTIDRARA